MTLNFCLVSFKANGVSSLIRTNGVQAVAGDIGSNNPFGFCIGATSGSAVPFGGNLAEVLIYSSNLTAQNISDIELYLNTKYSIF